MSKKKNKLTALIDGDILLFQITSAAEQPFYWGDDLWTLHSDGGEVRERIDNEINQIKRDVGASDVIIALSGSSNWRKTFMPSYKANRKNTRKPVAYSHAKAYVSDVYECASNFNLEADDILGILSTGKKKKNKDTVIVSADKDLKTIPGLIYNPDKPELGVVQISKDQADWNHLFQTLTGDAADGYSGCPGIGPKSAERALGEVGRPIEELWQAVLGCFADAGLQQEEALCQARVARILRNGEYDFTESRVHLWMPPGQSADEPRTTVGASC
jgi:DNA polymerase-1